MINSSLIGIGRRIIRYVSGVLQMLLTNILEDGNIPTLISFPRFIIIWTKETTWAINTNTISAICISLTYYRLIGDRDPNEWRDMRNEHKDYPLNDQLTQVKTNSLHENYDEWLEVVIVKILIYKALKT